MFNMLFAGFFQSTFFRHRNFDAALYRKVLIVTIQPVLKAIYQPTMVNNRKKMYAPSNKWETRQNRDEGKKTENIIRDELLNIRTTKDSILLFGKRLDFCFVFEKYIFGHALHAHIFLVDANAATLHIVFHIFNSIFVDSFFCRHA